MFSKLWTFSSTKKLFPISIIVRNYGFGKGSGSGKGGGQGGAVRDAGGAFGEMGAVREDEYFYKEQKKKIEQLREGKKIPGIGLQTHDDELQEGENSRKEFDDKDKPRK